VREIGPLFVKLIETSEAPLSFNNASLVKRGNSFWAVLSTAADPLLSLQNLFSIVGSIPAKGPAVRHDAKITLTWKELVLILEKFEFIFREAN